MKIEYLKDGTLVITADGEDDEFYLEVKPGEKIIIKTIPNEQVKWPVFLRLNIFFTQKMCKILNVGKK